MLGEPNLWKNRVRLAWMNSFQSVVDYAPFVVNFCSPYLNFGSTLSANRRMFFIAMSWGMPPK